VRNVVKYSDSTNCMTYSERINHMRKRKVLILTNLPQRDQATDILLAKALVQHGFDVTVTPFLPKAREWILFGKPDIVVGPECRCEFTVDFYARMMEWGVKVVAKRTEGGAALAAWDVMEEAERETTVGVWPYDVDLELVWSDAMKEVVAMHGHVIGKKITAVGALPLDPYFVDEKHLHPEGRKNVLIATGWGHADRSPAYNVPEAPPESPIHKDAFDRHTKGRAEYIKLINKLKAELEPEYNIYLRMKVGEHPEDYINGCPGLMITQPCDTKIALLNTDYLVHAGSTMGLEAHLMDVPAFSYLGQMNQTAGYDYPNVSPDFDNIDDMVEAIKAAVPGKTNANLGNFKRLEEEFYGVIDGKAAQRAANAIANLPDDGIPTTPLAWPASEIEYTFPDASKQPVGWVCETCGQITYSIKDLDMLKCLYCGISLAKRKG